MATDKTQKTLEERRSQVEAWVASNKASYSSNNEMAVALEQAFIFGEISANNHYLIDDILAMVNEVNPAISLEETNENA